jgi:hypothetical protein
MPTGGDPLPDDRGEEEVAAMTTVVLHPQADATDRAHAGRPGSGPEEASCGGCVWSVWREDGRGRRRLKCNLTDWDGRPATDIRPDDPACRHFDPQT